MKITIVAVLTTAAAPAREVEAVVRSPTNMAAAKIAAADYSKMTSKWRHSTGLLTVMCVGEDLLSQSTTSNGSAAMTGRKKSAENIQCRWYSQSTVMLAVSLCWPMSLTDVQIYWPASDGDRRSIFSSSRPAAASVTVTWPFSWQFRRSCTTDYRTPTRSGAGVLISLTLAFRPVCRWWINHSSLWLVASAMPHRRLPSRPQDIAALQLAPNFLPSEKINYIYDCILSTNHDMTLSNRASWLQKDE